MRVPLKFQALFALSVTLLVPLDLPSQSRNGRPVQGQQTESEASKQRLRQTIEQDPYNKEALFRLAQLTLEEGDFASADALFRRYLVISPSEPGAWAYLVRCAVGQSDPKEAAEAQRQIEALAPTNVALHIQVACWLAGSGIADVTGREFELALSLAPKQSRGEASWYSRLGQCYERAQDQHRAVRALQAALDLDPQTEDNYFRLAHLLAREGRVGEASEVMDSAVARFPRSVKARVEAGAIDLEAGNPERALQQQQQAAILDPQFPRVHSLLGRIQLTQRHYPEATATLEESAKLAPTDAGIHFYAGQAWMKADDGTGRALDHFKRSLELDPNRASTYYWIGSLYFHRNHEYRDAAQYLEQALARAPELEAAHQMLIQAYKRLGEDAKAAEELRRYQEFVEHKARSSVEAPK